MRSFEYWVPTRIQFGRGAEEKTAEDLVKKMELFGGDAKGLYMLNSEMAARTYSAPSLTL